MKIRLGSRNSKLARAQTILVMDLLKAKFPEIELEIITFDSEGDLDLVSPISALGNKRVFVTAIEQKLYSGEIDLAIHSLKDLGSFMPQGLALAGVLKREQANDVVVTDDLKQVQTFFTGSLRRAMQIKRHFNISNIVNIRGNVQSRIEKCKKISNSGLLLAQAGINRLQLEHLNYISLPIDKFIPAPGQGIIAIQSRCNELDQYIEQISCKETMKHAQIELQIAKALDLNCSFPAAIYAKTEGELTTVSSTMYLNDGLGDLSCCFSSNNIAELVNNVVDYMKANDFTLRAKNSTYENIINMQ
jgi:hydroxymethylbilane synthase